MTDDPGRATGTTIVPGCHDGRWPHIHSKAFATPDSAISGDKSLLTSQFALPEAVIAEIYPADAHYPDGSANLTQMSFASDTVFGDNSPEQLAAQTPAMTGDAAHGHTARVTRDLA